MATAERVEGAAQAEQIADLPYASPSLRIVAGILDLIVVASFFALFVAAAGLFVLIKTSWGDTDLTNDQGWRALIILLSYFLFLPWYFASLWWWRGQTVGMMAVRIAVTDSAGSHLSFWKSLLRTLVWPLSVVPLGMGLLPIFFDRHSRALHDMLAGTVVVELP